jgi:(1->4)-alpha-D-glucan 1-alpha-D-glucosylmutase
MPDEWEKTVMAWGQMNAAKKAMVNNRPAPDRNDEYLLYQTLVGAWPLEAMDKAGFAAFRERIAGYMQKATKEAKVHTSWINANQDYDNAVSEFVARVLPDQPSDPFLKDLSAFQRKVACFGQINSLSQTLLKLACPGVPDFYQGSELWDYSLVDPDNRRPIDYSRRSSMLADLVSRISRARKGLLPLVQELLDRIQDGRAKLYLIQRVLAFRQQHPVLFDQGSYVPLECLGHHCEHVVAFERCWREQSILVIVPRLVLRLMQGAEKAPIGNAWKDTRLVLPAPLPGTRYRNLFTGEELAIDEQSESNDLPISVVLANFPVALLERYTEPVLPPPPPAANKARIASSR